MSEFTENGPRVAIIRNPDKAGAEATMASAVRTMSRRAKVVATGVLAEAENLLAQATPDRVIVLGGDGSILAVAQALGDKQVPIVGVNFGKLGYLAEFSVEDMDLHLEAILNDPTVVSRRMMLESLITRDKGETISGTAVNDCVVHAGPPYRMIELVISIDGHPLTRVSGDGLVLATPSGSTAHNMAVGGPIIQSDVQAIALSPISPHSLTHQPLVVSGDSQIDVLVGQANAGTTVVIDGQISRPLSTGDRLTARRAKRDFLLVHNPSQPRWYTLTKKIKWGQ